MITRQPILELVFDGPAIYEGRILLVDLFDFVSNFQSAIQKTIAVLTTGQSARLGRPPKVLQELSALEIAGITQGSFGITLDFRREAAHLPLFDLGETAIEKLISGLRVIGNDTQLPEGFDQGVLIALREAGRILDRGINTVHINSPRYAHNVRAAYAAQTRERIVAQIRKFEQAWAVVEGRLLMADVKEDVLRCRIHPSTGEPIIGIFDEDMLSLIVNNLRSFVRVKGEASVDPFTDRIHSLIIKDIETIAEPSDTLAPVIAPSGFWQPKTFDNLALEQGIYPIEDWGSVSGQWPEDANFETFLEAVTGARQEPDD